MSFPRIILSRPYQEIHRPEYMDMTIDEVRLEASKMVDENGKSRVIVVVDHYGHPLYPRTTRKEKKVQYRPKKEDFDHVKHNVQRRYFERLDREAQASGSSFERSRSNPRNAQEGGHT